MRRGKHVGEASFQHNAEENDDKSSQRKKTYVAGREILVEENHGWSELRNTMPINVMSEKN